MTEKTKTTPCHPIKAPCLTFLVTLLLTTVLHAQPGEPMAIDADGTVHMPAITVPVSELMSPAGQAYLVEHLLGLRNPESFRMIDGVPALIAGYLDRQRMLYPATKTDTTIGGVHAIVYDPAAGIAPENRNRVLINLHGGGFSGCWLGCAELESLAVAGIGRIRVVSLDYRQGPDYRFPAASEDVAAAYTALLADYAPENIGIYGCSAGGMLTAQAMAWFMQENIPLPGAIGVLCAGAAPTSDGFGGDAGYFTMPLGEGRVMPTPENPVGIGGGPDGYFANVALDDPLVAPTQSPQILAQFPPTLILSGTRSYDLSNAVYTHSQLVKHGVDADLHVWEGMFHGFFYNSEVPESQEAFAVIRDFFDTHLGR